MTDNTPTWLDLLAKLDADRRNAERELLEAMTEDERNAYLLQRTIDSIVNLP